MFYRQVISHEWFRFKAIISKRQVLYYYKDIFLAKQLY